MIEEVKQAHDQKFGKKLSNSETSSQKTDISFAESDVADNEASAKLSS